MIGFMDWLSPTIDGEEVSKLADESVELVVLFLAKGIEFKQLSSIKILDFTEEPLTIQAFAEVGWGKFAKTNQTSRHPETYQISGRQLENKIKIITLLNKSNNNIQNVLSDLKSDTEFVISHELGHAQRYIPSGRKFDSIMNSTGISKSSINKYHNDPVEMEANLAAIAIAYEKIKGIPTIEDLLSLSVSPDIKQSLLSSPKRRRALLQRLAREGFVTKEMQK